MSKEKYFNVFLASLETSQFPKVYRGLQKGEADLLKRNAPGALELKAEECRVFTFLEVGESQCSSFSISW